MWNQAIPAGPLRDVLVIKQYGDLYFLGSHSGVLRIYYAPLSKGGLDVFNRRPTRQFNFIEHNNAAAIWCLILNVDVMERKDGHTVFIAMPQKITVLKLKHKLGTKANSTNMALDRHSIDWTLSGWITDMLKLRAVQVTFNGNTRAIVAVGCPQGGVLSPLL